MILFDRSELGRAAKAQNFNRDTYEKVIRLAEILSFINRDAYLKDHLILKGGTAINLTIVNMPRLSVDIDMDVVPNVPKEEMLQMRDVIARKLKAYMESEESVKIFL
ncbi:MAG: nucleotidyl transferase AbiEii/AbiGii toxin family protein [Parasporobacterium sp.]|nr:nucleotidyl transferase AbiEii/AbiGii toxin family protein [Parasporobacterium sp.]